MHEWFGADGLLAQVVPQYEARAGQADLAQAMADALEVGEPSLGEAGTGIGKGMAYLAALVASGKKALISTYTKALQDQLAGHDIPLLQRVRPGVTAAVLKGRRNYLCLYEFGQVQAQVAAGEQLGLFHGRTDHTAFERLRQWLYTADGEAAAGDLAALPFSLPEDVRALVTVDGQSCLGRKCPAYGDCYAQKAKAAAEAAELVVVNHRLLLLDLALSAQTDGEASVLPQKDVVVLDECHHLEAVATESFGAEITVGRWAYLERRVRRLADELRARQEQQVKLGLERRGPAVETIERVVALAVAVRQESEAWFGHLLTALGEKKSLELRYVLAPSLSTAGATLAERSLALATARPGIWGHA